MSARKKTVPLISSNTAGPLGVIHLPRLWLKASLEARGKIAPGYPGAGKGYDQMVIDGLGLNREKVLDYIKTSRPNYVQFEAWVKEQPGVKLDKATIDASNAAIRGYNHGDETRAGIFKAVGLDDASCDFRCAADLNNLEDWQEFYDAELKEDAAPVADNPQTNDGTSSGVAEAEPETVKDLKDPQPVGA